MRLEENVPYFPNETILHTRLAIDWVVKEEGGAKDAHEIKLDTHVFGTI